MEHNVLSTARWLGSLSRRLVSVVPGYSFCSVAVTLLSQVSVLLASVLPLKVILLLGSDHIPRYFPEQFQSFDRQSLILMLSGLAVLFFLLHLLGERLIVLCVARGSAKLLLRSRKMVLFENQDNMAAQAYQQFSRGFASLVFLFLGVPLLYWLSSMLTVVFGLYLLVAVAAMFLIYLFKPRFQAQLLSGSSAFLGVLGGIGFLICFGFIVFEFLWLSAPSVLVAVVCLLLLRQLFRHITTVIKEALALADKRRQLSALFFHGQRLVDVPKHNFKGVWSLIEPDVREVWLGQAIREVVSVDMTIKSVQWLQIGISDVVAFRVVAIESENELEESRFFVKIFGTNRSTMATHEATLLSEQKGLPALELIGVTDVEGQYHCHVFTLDSARQALGKKWPVRCEVARTILLGCVPTDNLETLFNRSRSTLPQRLERNALTRMRHLLHDPKQLEELSVFEAKFDEMRAVLGRLPMSYVNPDIRRGTVMLDDHGFVPVCHWARWSLEPVGSGWPINDRSLSLLSDAHADAVTKRADMNGIKVSHLKFVAVIFEFEKLCNQQNYHGAADLLGIINKLYSDVSDIISKV